MQTLSRDSVKLENISPALLHAERLCEMKALVALSEVVVSTVGLPVMILMALRKVRQQEDEQRSSGEDE